MENKDKIKVVLDFLSYIKEHIDEFKFKKSQVYKLCLKNIKNPEDELSISMFTYDADSADYIQVTGTYGFIEAKLEYIDCLKARVLLSEIKEKYEESMIAYVKSISV